MTDDCPDYINADTCGLKATPVSVAQLIQARPLALGE